jgi:iodotyrosine deiodinase
MNEHPCLPLTDFVEYTNEETLERSRNFYKDIKRRHTIRSFSDRPVDREVIENCILAAGSAPSGANHQPWHFTAISDPDVKKVVREKAEIEERNFYAGKAGEEWLNALGPLGTDDKKPFLETAPWLIAIFAQKRGGVSIDDEGKNYYVTESCGIATGFLINALHSAGLATLTHTPNPMRFLNDICDRPKSERPFILMVVGYPAEDATVPLHAITKKSLAEISTFL